jgi:hypothetical protein
MFSIIRCHIAHYFCAWTIAKLFELYFIIISHIPRLYFL